MANPFGAAADIQNHVRPRASFAGASRGRLYWDWAVSAMHPDREIRYAARELRARARDLVRNNAYGAGIVDAFADNIIGPPGIRLKPTITDSQAQPRRDIQGKIIRGWMEWGVPETCSVDGMDSWVELQRLMIRGWVTDGEIFIRERKGAPNRFGYALELVDPDLLDETFNVPPDSNGVEIRMGIEMDSRGRRLAYHFSKRHPSERYTRDRDRIPAEEIIHWFIRHRPGQSRGYSLFAPVLTTLKHIDGLSEAELVASRLAAAKMGFITNDSDAAIASYTERLEAQLEDGEEPPSPEVMEVAPGLIEELIPGQKFEGFDPTHPNTAFEAFFKIMLRGVSRGFGMSYLTATGDVSDANYSSMRAGLIPERDHWRAIQIILSTDVHRIIYRHWIDMQMLTGALDLPTSEATHYYPHKWRPRGWKWVDPLKDMMGLELAIALGISSRSRGAAEQGNDYEAVVLEIEDEEAFAREHGVDVSGLKRDASDLNAFAQEPASGNGNNSDGNGRLNRIAAFRHLMEVLEDGD